MLTDISKNLKGDSAEKGTSPKKMILVARDYIHYMRVKDRSNGAQEYAKIDGVCVAIPSMAQLLASLKEDLRCATTIFLEEFIECGGVECLLDVLRSNLSHQNKDSPTKARQQQIALRKSLIEQYDCLMSLKYASKSLKTLKRLADDAHGISSITSCIMSTATKTRVLALELLCRMLECCSRGHTLILDALTANRVLFGEPLRFKFLVGMIHSSCNERPVFQSEAVKFLNAVLRTSSKPSERIRLQCELEEAGFNISELETALRRQSVQSTDPIWEEIRNWKNSYLDMEDVTGKQINLKSENDKLHKEVQLLRQALQKLEEDKINLMQIEMELKEKCDDLNDEVTTLKTEMVQTKTGSEKSLQHRPSFIFSEEDELFHSSIDSGHLETEEIFIDVPTIRPPIEFCNDNHTVNNNNNDCIKLLDKKSHLPRQSINANITFCVSKPVGNTSIHSSDKESADSALSESESDSGLNWNYPQVPVDSTSIVRHGRLRKKVALDEVSTVFRDSNRKKLQRSQSEDRRESIGETKVADSSGFFMRKRPDARQPSKDGCSTNSPSYQLPVAYRSNFLARGHSNCDLYSGMTSPEPPIPPPDYALHSVATSGGTISALVHREITKAVRQISGWI